MKFQEIRSSLQSADEEVRRSALNLLREYPGPDTSALIFFAMGDESWRVRKEAVECYLYLQPDRASIEELLNLLRNDENAGLRNSAAEAVIRLGSAAADPLLNLVNDPDAEVRKFVIDVMGAVGDPSFVPALLAALTDPDVNVASAAAEQLGSLGDANSAEPLLHAILARDEVLFRFSSLRALSILAQPLLIPGELVSLADQDILRKAVYECLGAIADCNCRDVLLKGFTCSQKSSRAAAVKALYKIFERAGAPAQEAIEEAVRRLANTECIVGIQELGDHRDKVLTDALLWIGAITGDSRFIPLLIKAYTDERTATAALTALKKFDQSALQEVISRYATFDECGRSGLCILIAEFGYAGFTAILHEGVCDASSRVRAATALAVGRLGLSSFIPDLFRLVDDSDGQVCAAAVDALLSLARINPSLLLAEVEHFSSSHAVHHRKAAAQLLAVLGEGERLLTLVKDEDSQVRKAAVTAIGVNRIEMSGSILILALADEEPDVRIAVAEALGLLQDVSTLDALEHALNDDDVWVQSAVLKAIATINPVRAWTIISKIHTEASGLLLITSLQILELVGGSGAEQIIRHALGNSDQDIVRQADRSLERIRSGNTR